MKCRGVPLIRLEMSDLKVYSTPGHGAWFRSEQFTAVLLEKSVHAHLLQHNFPMLSYFEVKACNAFFACSVLTSDLKSFSSVAWFHLEVQKQGWLGIDHTTYMWSCVELFKAVGSWHQHVAFGWFFKKWNRSCRLPGKASWLIWCMITASQAVQTQAQVFVRHKLTAGRLQHRMPTSPFLLLSAMYVEGYKSKYEVPPNCLVSLCPPQPVYFRCRDTGFTLVLAVTMMEFASILAFFFFSDN